MQAPSTSRSSPRGKWSCRAAPSSWRTSGRWDILAELMGKLHDLDSPLRSFESVTVGGYYRLIPNLKVGALARLQAGARHDDDVIANLPTNKWDWNDTSSRLEGVLMLDASPRFQLGFPAGRELGPDAEGPVPLQHLERPDVDHGPSRADVVLDPGQGSVPESFLELRDVLPAELRQHAHLPELPLPHGALARHARGSESSSPGHTRPPPGRRRRAGQAAAWDSYSTAVSTWAFSLGVVYTPSF